VARDLGRQQIALAVAHPVGQTRDVLRRAANEDATAIAVFPTISDAVDHLKSDRE
jgi:sulfate permease, SulP family